MNTSTNTKWKRAPVIGHTSRIRYKCRSHFIKQIYELAAIIDLDIFIRWNCYWNRSWNWCSGCDPIWGAYNNVPCPSNQDWTAAVCLGPSLVYNSIADPNSMPPPPRNCSQVTHCCAVHPTIPPPRFRLMHVRAPDIIVVQACVAHSLRRVRMRLRVWVRVWLWVRVEYSLRTVGQLLHRVLDSGSDCVRGWLMNLMQLLAFGFGPRIVAWHFLPYSSDVFAHELCVFMIYIP